MQAPKQGKGRLSFHPSLLFFALLAVVLTSGCIGQGALTDFFPGAGLVKVSRPVVDPGITDLITVENVRTLPAGQVLPDTTLKLFMSLVNNDKDPTRPVKDVIVDMFDATVFRSPNTGRFCNADPNECKPSQCSSGTPCTMRAGETKAIDFTLLAPTKDQIANIRTEAAMNFRVNYDFSGSTNYDILVVDSEELLRLQQEGKSISVSVQDTKGAGPIKIDVSLFTPFVVTSGGETPDAFIVFKLRNAGKGALKDNRIKQMTIDFPEDMLLRGNIEHPLTFNCYRVDSDGLAVRRCEHIFTKENKIELFKRESDPLQFVIKGIKPIDVPHKTFTINARVDYTYELRGSAKVTVAPQQIR